MSSDFLYRSFGAVDYPSHAHEVADNGSFTAFDPGIDQLIAYFKAVLLAELGPVFDGLKSGLTSATMQAASVVADTMYEQPRASALRESNYTFPLLAVYRTIGRHEWHTMQVRKQISELTVEYILPPMVAEDVRRVMPMLSAAVKAIDLAIEERAHPAYASNAIQFYNGLTELGEIRSGFSAIEMAKSKVGRADFAGSEGGMEFPIAVMHLDASEVDRPSEKRAGEGTFDSVLLREHVDGIKDHVVVDTDAP